MNAVRTAKRADAPLMPRAAIAAVVAVVGLAAADAVAGGLAGFTLFGLRWSEADREIVIPALTERVLRICFWHNLIWFPLRVIAGIAVRWGSRTGRIAAITLEIAAFAVWLPVFFIGVEGSNALYEQRDITAMQITAAVCLAGSVAVIALLSTYGTRSWCDRR